MDRDLWIFAYGSLLWRPGFDWDARMRARLDGYRRSFCMESIHYRGTKADPGLVLALDPCAGAVCEGLVYRVDAARADAVLAYLRERELISYAYVEAEVVCTLSDGKPVTAVTYVINRDSDQYCGTWPLERQAEVIARASGQMGPNWEYLETTVERLGEMGCPDAELEALAHRVRALRGVT